MSPITMSESTRAPNFVRRPRRQALALSLLLLAIGPSGARAAQSAPAAPSSAPASPSARPRVAMVGLTCPPETDPRDAWVALGVEETLSWRLRRTPGVVTIPTARLHQARRELHDAGHPDPAWPAVVELLGGRLLITGQAAGTPDALTITLELREIGNGSAPRRGALGPGRMFAVLDEATAWINDSLGVVPPSGDPRSLAFSAPAATPTAIEYYAKALGAARADRMADAVYYADEAIRFDPRYRPALSMLAQVGQRLSGEALATALRRMRVLSELARQNGDWVDRAEAELMQGVAVMVLTAPEPAILRFENGLRIYREHDEPYGRVSAMGYLADAHLSWRPPLDTPLDDDGLRRFAEEKLALALDWQSRVLDELTALGDVVAQMPAMNKLALICERLGQHDRAFELHRRTIELAQRARSPRSEASAWMFLAQWHRTRKDWPDALAAARRCLELASLDSRPAVHVALAEILREMTPPQPAEALQQYQAACAELEKGDDLHKQLLCLENIAELQYDLGRRDAAVAALNEAIDLAHALRLPAEAELRARLARWRQPPD